LATGETCGTSSASTWSVNPCGTCHTKTLPSSDPEATILSWNGFLIPCVNPYLYCQVVFYSREEASYQSVSRTAAVCPRNSGSWSGSLPLSLTGIMANAPPPLDSQLTEMYSGLTCLAASTFRQWAATAKLVPCVIPPPC
jgi:hypothetical protein